MKNQNWVQKLSFKFGRYAISNLMMYIVTGMAIVYAMDMMFPVGLSSLLTFNKTAIMRGEIWRLFTFIIIPPSSSMIFIIINLYFYWLLGSTLENEWGSFKFNLFYLCGMLGTMIAGIITGYATNYYINMSLFFAFAILYPNYQFLIFFMIPVKVKYLAYIDAAFFLYMFINNSWRGRTAILFSILNLIVFFGNDLKNRIQQEYRRAMWKRNFR